MNDKMMSIKVDPKLWQEFKDKVEPFTVSAFIKMLMKKVVEGELVFEAILKDGK